MKVIEIFNLYKNFNNKCILKNINLSVEKSEIIAITGESGKGKSTFLRCIIGLETIDFGSIKIDNEFLIQDGKFSKKKSEISKKLGLIFQDFNLFNHLTVIKNIEIPAKNSRLWSKEQIFNKSNDLIKRLKIDNIQNDYPINLSGGQKQRVAIARALIMEPKIILFDEPTSALDPQLVTELTVFIKELSKSRYTIMIITHDVVFAQKTADSILNLENGNFE
ncbi:MAG: polar amino acid transport system ATP-binding protein [Candidatus Paraimprobicoccus trichonymphae]|uniref:Polar amino acid transport system ATP-binding protein n=1 Tax=Candidatus Paraimprobicoccus trichonymphae TaxID=3033793 RepID=A0AA48I6G1_9FIRM|nr:MAG: polar amino acid transport system ATP-binding protein [Candidatus Paraimprobicoccus trichonymphae]